MSTRTRPAATGMFLTTPPARSRGGRSRARMVITIVAVVGVALAAAAAALAIAERNRIPVGTSIAGVDVGGKTPHQAAAAVRKSAAQRAQSPISLGFPGGPATITGTQLGAKPRVERAVERAADAGVVTRVRARLGLGGKRRIGLAYRLDPARVATIADELDARVATPATDARVTIATNGTTRVRPAKNGGRVDRVALAYRLRLLPRSVVAPIQSVAPLVSTVAAERAQARADRLLAAPRQVVLGTTAVTLTARELRSALRFEPGDGGLTVRLDPNALRGRLQPKFRRLEVPARDASFRITTSGVVVRPAATGRRLDVEGIATSITRNLRATVHRARFVPLPPALTTAAAEKLHVTDLVSEFTTYYPCCAPRVTNIKRAAELLDGTVVRPGKRFSLNDALGQRTEDKGFVSAPQIRAGRLEDSVGGGISQVATTLYNAAFFAGLRLDAHQAHQFYISRYPMGREATVSWGGPELIFTNDWPAGLLLKVYADDGSITVRFYSSKLGRRVETVTDEPYAYRAPTTNVTRNNALDPGTRVVEQDAGASGFSVQYTREVFRGPKRIRNERYTVRYDPQNAYVEEGPPARPSPEQSPKPKPDKTATEKQDNAAASTPPQPAPTPP
jgi:vancomycin resistance protein YoaR